MPVMKTIFSIIAFFAACLLFACGNNAELPTVTEVDLARYAGKWYEIASFPTSFQKDCQCTTATYTQTDKGYVKVYNQCRKGAAGSKTTDIEGKAFPASGSNNARLKVQFFPLVKAPYYIIGLDSVNYQYAMVGAPSRNYLWILSRNPQLEPDIYDRLTNKASQLGFDVNRLKRTIQDCPM
ncbi:hypothetical protein C7N43_08660 [Sphingobacteriales bacterium UPWRP_1]|nr:hypothetical protein BVG80_10770 [Sphingobacteriales bacterium TSM_CSM]PSJ77404.1 hypothetical protein C7N43_08660 [Sphingobacteriales bacterium UPWRP_1]